MSHQFHSSPILIKDGNTKLLSRILVGKDSGKVFNEDYIRNLAFDNPCCLPIFEIDGSYRDPVPVCKELRTQVGSIDAVFITKTGQLVLLEAKLWKNPEARRKVIGQILDYAKELKKWGYEDLQREVSRTTGIKGNVLYQIVQQAGAEISESQFVDAVTRSLNTGRFLLLVVGDGIREGAASIADFIQQTGTMEFTLGMVEMALYQCEGVGVFVQPRVLVKTEIIERSVFEFRGDRIAYVEDADEVEVEEEGPRSREFSELQLWYFDFWKEFLTELQLDDPHQRIPAPTKINYVDFTMLSKGNRLAWISPYFLFRINRMGVWLTFQKGALGDRILATLLEDRDIICSEISDDIDWGSLDDGEKHWVCVYHTFEQGTIRDPEKRAEIKQYMAKYLNEFINTFGPRLKRLSDMV